jgi:hypothetical protein
MAASSQAVASWGGDSGFSVASAALTESQAQLASSLSYCEALSNARSDFWGISDDEVRSRCPPLTPEGLRKLRQEFLNPILRWSPKGRLELCQEYLTPFAGGPPDGMLGLLPKFLKPVVEWPSQGRSKIYGGLALSVCVHGLEGFGVAMLPFAALKQAVHSTPVQWGIAIPAFFAIMVPAFRRIIPRLDSTMMEWEKAAVDTAQVVLQVYPVDPSHLKTSRPASRGIPSPDAQGVPTQEKESATKTSLEYLVNAYELEGSQLVMQEIQNLVQELATRDALKVLIQNTIKTQVKAIESVCGILWNLGAGNALVQNGYIGLISCATACISTSLSALVFLYTGHSVDKYLTAQDSELLATERGEVTRRRFEDVIKRCQPAIAAPILTGIACTLGSVLGAAFLFHRSGKAETQADRDIENREFFATQLYPSAVSFIFVAGHLANLAHALFERPQREAHVVIEVLQQIWTRVETLRGSVKYANRRLELESGKRHVTDELEGSQRSIQEVTEASQNGE